PAGQAARNGAPDDHPARLPRRQGAPEAGALPGRQAARIGRAGHGARAGGLTRAAAEPGPAGRDERVAYLALNRSAPPADHSPADVRGPVTDPAPRRARRA